MKLLQLNMWGGRLGYQIGDLLKEEMPDIICLQEAHSFGRQSMPTFITVEEIQTLCNLDFSASGPVFSFNYMNSTAHFGNYIISRYPILKSEVIFTYSDHNHDYKPNDDYNVRNFVHTEIQTPKGKLDVVTHHGFHVHEHKDGNDETERQMEILHEYISQLSNPVILTGDFNLHPNSKSLSKLNKELTNLSLEHKLTTTRNELTHKTEVCDYIFTNQDIQVNSFRMPDKIVSDHQALILEFIV